MTGPTSSWYAVARSHDIKRKPRRVIVEGRPIVLFRAAGTVTALLDACPHRSAPLSGGRVVQATIECPYHGWRFDVHGRCILIPGLIGPTLRAAVPTFAAVEADGLVFVSLGSPKAAPYTGILRGSLVTKTLLESSVDASLADVAENILDATHTHFTHKGLLRGLSTKRNRVTVTVTGGDDWVEARYEAEARQDGLVSRLLEGERSISVGRFKLPGIAELEFWGAGKINLATTFYLREVAPDRVVGLGVLAGYRQGGVGYLKALLLKPLFAVALKQDQKILETSNSNRIALARTMPTAGPLDVMRPHIDALLAGRRPDVADSPRTLIMEL